MIVDLSVLLTVVVGFVTVNLGSVYIMRRLERRIRATASDAQPGR